MAGGSSLQLAPQQFANYSDNIDGGSHSNNRAMNSHKLCFPRNMHSEALMNGLNALRCAGKLFDVSLIVEGRKFKAHRVVLAACSDYFCAMFTDSMREATQAEINLNGVSARGIELLIEYAYTSHLELDRNNVQDLLSVSTHVQMKSVIDACSNFLEMQIDLENCVAIASLADLYSLELLKKKTYRYLCSRFEEFASSPELLTLGWEQLEYILSCNYPVDCPEERVLQLTLQYCVEMKLKPELASRLFAHIRFNQIDCSALRSILNSMLCDNAAESSATAENLAEHCKDSSGCRKHQNYDAVYYPVLRAEILAQQCSQALLDPSATSTIANSDNQLIIPQDVLTNSRGMELALVKIGGFETNGLTNQISCYLPSKGKWENLTAIPHIEQCNYGTAVLGNDLYVVGGSYDVCLKEYIHPFGFRYCPTKNAWKTIAPIQADRCRFSLNAMGKYHLLAVGGVCEFNDSEADGIDQWPQDMAVSNCERYDSMTDRWEYLPALVENRSQHAGVVLGDKLYISGGIDRHIVLSSLWCFDTKTEKWSKLSPMSTPRADHVLIALDGNIYACGGWYEDAVSETRVLVETIDVYDPINDVWSMESVHPIPKYYPGVSAVKRKIYFIGGLLSNATINRATSAVQCYDLDTKLWTLNSDWEFHKEVWECTCAVFYVPRERDFKYYWSGNSTLNEM